MKSRVNFILALSLALATGCEWRQAMYDNGRIKPYEETQFFSDKRTARPLVDGTVARGQLKEDDLFHTGRVDGKLSAQFPFAIDDAIMARGQERYNIFCSVCHGVSGQGDGMIVQRGFPRPASFHEARLKNAPAGYFFDAMTNGFGRMFSYADKLNPEDRWAVAAYIRALQRSRDSRWKDVPQDVQQELQEEAK